MKFRSRMVVDFQVLEKNFLLLKELCPNNEVIFMVKADAYGHGMLPVAEFVNRKCGVSQFGVATLEEAVNLREGLPKSEFEIYVFSDVLLDEAQSREHYVNKRIIPVIASFENLELLLENAELAHLPLCLKFNTGMNRLGINWDDAERVIRLLEKAERTTIHHLMSHFSSAALSVAKDQTQKQYDRFTQLKQFLQARGIQIEQTSMANSGAIEQGFALNESHIRPGLMMYGPSSLILTLRAKSQWKGQIVSRLESRVIDSFPVEKGTPVGYGATPVPFSGLLVILAIGYGDGFSTFYQGAPVEHKGAQGTVVGRVNMDMIQVLFDSKCPGISAGEILELWSHEPDTLYALVDKVKTIPYELFCLLTNRVSRVYING